MHLWTTRAAYGGAVAKRDEAGTYEAATEEILNTCEQEYLNSELPFLPPCPSMHYRWPHAFDRKGRPIDELYHCQWPKEGDLAARLKAIFNFVSAHPQECDAGSDHVLMERTLWWGRHLPDNGRFA